jgi:hypothetical protein
MLLIKLITKVFINKNSPSSDRGGVRAKAVGKDQRQGPSNSQSGSRTQSDAKTRATNREAPVRPRLGKALGGVKDVRHRARSGMGDI